VARPWSHPTRFGALQSPDYSRLPAVLNLKGEDTDPLPPTRTPNQFGLFYRTSLTWEYIQQGNPVFEDTDPSPDVDHEQPVLDTLIESRGQALLTRPFPAPTMTYYHGNQANQFVFSGFGPWSFARPDCIALFDFVLQDLWGLPRSPVDRGGTAAIRSARGAAPVRIVTPAQRAVRPAALRRY
jgi:hypothetical protein